MQASSWPRLHCDGPVVFFGGPYSNLHALEALLQEARRRGVAPQNIFSTGDLVAYCADGAGVVAQMRASGLSFVRGNCEAQLASGAQDCGCGFAPGGECDRLSNDWYAHAQRTLSDDDRAFLGAAPDGLLLEINGLTLAVIHGAAMQVNRFVFASTPMRIKAHDLDYLGLDGVIAGHSGLPFTQAIDGRLWHNPGALGMPANDGTPRVWFSIFSPGPTLGTLSIEHCALDYDAAGAAKAMNRVGLASPYAKTLLDGLWPNCDSLAPIEAKARGKALTPARIFYAREPHGLDTRLLWPALVASPPLNPEKFRASDITLTGEQRAHVSLQTLETLWINTGTLCNLACANCYIESTPRNDRLAYITASETRGFLDEIAARALATKTIGFTGGEPFMNPDFPEMLGDALSRGFDVLVLTNAMKPMRKCAAILLDLKNRYAGRLSLRVSVDHYTTELHELERGARTFLPTIEGLVWLAQENFCITVAGRLYSGEPETVLRTGYADLFERYGMGLDAFSLENLVLFPEMDKEADVPEITENCWGILEKPKSSVMCATSRMVVKRKGAAKPAVIACTLLPYDAAFELGDTLSDAIGPVRLNHPYCAKFCVLGGASCKA